MTGLLRIWTCDACGISLILRRSVRDVPSARKLPEGWDAVTLRWARYRDRKRLHYCPDCAVHADYYRLALVVWKTNRKGMWWRVKDKPEAIRKGLVKIWEKKNPRPVPSRPEGIERI